MPPLAKQINIALGTCTYTRATVGVLSSETPLLGQRFTITEVDTEDVKHLREYEGDGVNTYGAIVAAGKYRPAKAEVKAMVDAGAAVPGELVVVEGAGTGACNGTYVRNDSASIGSFVRYSGSPVYAYGSYVIVRGTDGIWNIYRSSSNEVEYSGDASVANPWATATWTADVADAPVPTVTQGTITLPAALALKLDAAKAVTLPATGYVPKAMDPRGIHAGWLPGKLLVVATTNIDLSSMPTTIDGHSMANGESFLAAGQTAPEQNGPYVFISAGGSASRMNQYSTFNAVAGSLITVAQGTANAGTVWQCTAIAGGTLGTDALPFVPLVKQSTFTALRTGVTINNQTGTSYTLALSDGGVDKYLRQSNAAAIVTTLPTNATVAFPINTIICGIQAGAGQVTLTPAAGVTITALDDARKTMGKGAPWTLVKTDTDTWDLFGALTT